jgi:AAA15 family ATPase/GTPase
VIKEFKVANYFSIYETQTISFSISKEDIEDESSFKTENGNNLNSIITVIGNNASGKTNILKALSFLLWFARGSYTSYRGSPLKGSTGIETHKLNSSKETDFELVFENNGKEYEYKLSLSRESVTYESLKVKNEDVFNAIYEIKKEEDSFSFSEWALGSINDVDKRRFIEIKNISMFSFLLSTGHLPAIGIKDMVNYHNNLGYLGKISEYIRDIDEKLYRIFSENPEIKEKVLRFVKDSDINISDFTYSNDGRGRLNVKHDSNSGKGFSLPFLQESNGTQNCINLLNLAMRILKDGGILIYDELESSLHPYLAKKIVGLFSNRETNPKYSQLLFSTHMPWLLNDRTRSQIYLVEKDKDFKTEVYRLDDVEGVENNEDFCTNYLAGAYGAVADMRWF